jgi:hypothetical protein
MEMLKPFKSVFKQIKLLFPQFYQNYGLGIRISSPEALIIVTKYYDSAIMTACHLDRPPDSRYSKGTYPGKFF